MKEFAVADADGGGLAFTRGRHPVLLQHRDPIVTLRTHEPPQNVAATIGALWHTHVEVADDWVVPERYLGSPERLWARLARRRGIVCRGPAFLVRRYKKVLQQYGASASVSSGVPRPAGSLKPVALLHFGNSFVVASSFTAGRAG